MNSTFIDASFFLALALKNDALNKRALAWQKFLRGPFFTSEFVLLELADGLSDVPFRSTAQALIHFVRSGKSMTVIPLGPQWLELGYQSYCRHADRDWSLTDCISFEIMHKHDITDALTHDHHFEQAGFRALLRHDPPSN